MFVDQEAGKGEECLCLAVVLVDVYTFCSTCA